MAIDEKRRQKQLAKKAAERKVKRQQQKSTSHTSFAGRATRFPVSECLMHDSFEENGIGIVILTRNLPGNNVALSSFLIDCFCLGCKEVMYRILSAEDFIEYKQQVAQGAKYKTVHPSCLRKFVEGAVAYARKIGFEPHSEYAVAAKLFGDIDANACPVKYTYGKDGKPLYLSGPNDTPERIRKILNKLERNLGTGNYDFVAKADSIDDYNTAIDAIHKKVKSVDEKANSVYEYADKRQSPVLNVINYGITDDPIHPYSYDNCDSLPENFRNKIQELKDSLFVNPRQAIADLTPIVKSYPNIPVLYNYLRNAYMLMGNHSKAQVVLEETIKRFPDYLFGKLALAEVCLNNGEFDKIPQIFNNQLDLKLLYPNRDVFHISEVLNFFAIMAMYFHAIGNQKQAELYYKMIQQLDPNDRLTKIVNRKLFGSPIKQLINKLLPW